MLDNVTKPLPLRILGGTEKDITDAHRENLKIRRNPVPKNGVAKNLFATDLLAISSGKMSLQIEEDEKELLRINEHFGLRGPEIDAAVASTQTEALEKITATAIKGLETMTLTRLTVISHGRLSPIKILALPTTQSPHHGTRPASTTRKLTEFPNNRGTVTKGSEWAKSISTSGSLKMKTNVIAIGWF